MQDGTHKLAILAHCRRSCSALVLADDGEKRALHSRQSRDVARSDGSARRADPLLPVVGHVKPDSTDVAVPVDLCEVIFPSREKAEARVEATPNRGPGRRS
jgi:hypothetical protein